LHIVDTCSHDELQIRQPRDAAAEGDTLVGEGFSGLVVVEGEVGLGVADGDVFAGYESIAGLKRCYIGECVRAACKASYVSAIGDECEYESEHDDLQ